MTAELDQSIFTVADAVRQGLSKNPKSLPPWLFYDAAGSALFEQITQLPEYYPSRTEAEIFSENAGQIIRAVLLDRTDPLRIIELGAGSALKTCVLLEAALKATDRVSYVPIDISRAALADAERNVSKMVPGVEVVPTTSDYVTQPVEMTPSAGRTLAMYIGSSIANFDPDEAVAILRNLRRQLAAGDSLLLGVDLVKESEVLLRAYDDSMGVTAEFNRNVLRRINAELGGNFDLDSFRHRAIWNANLSRIEMHLQSAYRQTVTIRNADLQIAFDTGETIHTENSYKYDRASIDYLLGRAGFQQECQWTDELISYSSFWLVVLKTH